MLMLSACGTSPANTSVLEADPSALIDAVTAVQPEPLVELIETPHQVVKTSDTCPTITVLETDEGTLKEQWQGGCTLDNGLRIDGVLERFDGPQGAWVSGDGFRVYSVDQSVFVLDGAVEISVSGDLWLIDAAAAICGTQHWPCTAGVLSLDLAYTIYPAALFPQDYDATVSGAFASEEGTYTLDGAWSIDDSVCGIEATHGMLSVRQGRHHALTLNGSEHCDGCLEWQIQGQPVPGLCGLSR